MTDAQLGGSFLEQCGQIALAVGEAVGELEAVFRLDRHGHRRQHAGPAQDPDAVSDPSGCGPGNRRGRRLQKELIVSPSKFLKKGALVILCSHGGNTNETVNAAKLAKERGAAVITMTHNPNSICAQEDMNPVVYSWEDDTNEKERPQGIVMRVLNELMKLQEPSYTKYEAVLDGLEKADGIVRAAVKKVQNRTWVFAEKYFEEPFLYIMGSGASYSQAYGFSICSLQEMQWMDCCYLHSGEYFHGPFECTDEDHLYILLMGTGAARVMDERDDALP